jgi:nucleotide-binding universal stress UspA family protein
MEHGRGLIVVGVDGWPAADRALGWAVQLAEQVGASVEVVTAQSSDATQSSDGFMWAENIQRAAVERVLSGRRGSPVLSMQVVEGKPGPALVDATRRADLLVLGSHGHRRAYELTVGSTSDFCLRNASCPVVVIPVPVHDERAGHDEVANAARSTSRG